MRRLKHIGLKPSKLPLERIEIGKRRVVYHEVFEDGSYKIWNNKLLRGGCNRTVTDIKEDGNLIYCPTCKEWFNESQFKEESV